MSFSSWVKDDPTEETPLLSVPQWSTSDTATVGEAAAALTASIATPPSNHSSPILHSLTEVEVKDVASSEVLPQLTPAIREAAAEARIDPSYGRSETVSLHVSVTAEAPQSSLCTVTDTLRSPHSSIMTCRVVSSDTGINSLGMCCRGSTTSSGPVPHSLASSNQSLNEASGSSKKSSIHERLAKIWSTPAEANAECEGENSEGADLRCRKCGKFLSMSRIEESRGTAKAGQAMRSTMSRDCPQTGSFRDGMQHQQPSIVLHPGWQHHLQACNEHKQRNSHNYSTLLSTCSRNIKKGSRRQSVDVIYAREPTEPVIDKIKAKRRLSRQTDVSSVELMTLNEGNELEDILGKELTGATTTESYVQPSVAALQVQGENIQLSHCQLSPAGTIIKNLRASSSTESCPRVPWNSLETNFSSSQETEEKYIINELRGHSAPQTFNREPHSNLDVEADTDQEGRKSDQGENSSDDDADINAGSARRRPSSAKLQDQQTRSGRLDGESMVCQDWSAEAVVLVALLVYIACKVMNFLDSLAPRRTGNRK